MERVLDRVWIGGASDLEAPLVELGFTGLLDLRDGTRPAIEGLAIHRITNRDGDPWTREQVLDALDFVAEQVERGRVLIACTAGMSRSACMVIGFLVRSGWGVTEAYMRLKQARPQILPVRKMLDSVLEAVGV